MRSPFDPRATEESDGPGRLPLGSMIGPGPGRPPMPMGFVAPPGAPPWLTWLQVGLTSMLAVLLAVSLVRSREQSIETQRLRQRIRLLEASRSFDRSAAQDQQIQSVIGRVQTLEEVVSRRLQASERERQRLEQQLLELHTNPRPGRLTPGIAPQVLMPTPAVTPRLQGASQAPAAGTMPLRPPPQLP
jgi:hypothetical protein